MLKTISNRRTSAPSVIRPQMAARLIRLRKTLAAGHTADYSTRIRLVRGGRFFRSASKFGGPVHPDFSNKVSADRIGTAKFEAVFSVKIAKVIPITRPDGPNSGAPDPPSPVRAS